jgi:hypothetical protein
MAKLRALTRLLLLAALAAVFACGPAPRQRPVKMGDVDTGAGTLTMARKYLEGRWTLESFEVHPPGKEPIQLKGSGDLEYDEFGNLRMEIRADEASADVLRAAGIDIQDGRISSNGRTVVDLQHKTLTYVIEGQPAGTGTGPLAANRRRHWVVEGDMLTLTTKDDAGNPLSVGRWRKVKQEG